MNKEMITFGAVALLMCAFYFLGGTSPQKARKDVRRSSARIRGTRYAKPSYAPVHRIDTFNAKRDPDSLRRFVDARERDPFARPSIGRRLPLPELEAPPISAEDLALLSPPPAQGGSWLLLGRLLRGPLVEIDPRVLARAEEAFEQAEEDADKAAREAEQAAAEESSAEQPSAAEAPEPPPQAEPWREPDIAATGYEGLLAIIAQQWSGRYEDSARMEFLQRAIERLLAIDPERIEGLLWKGRLLDDRIEWDDAFVWYRDRLIGADGKGPHVGDARACLGYARFLRRTGLIEEAVRWARRAVEALATTPRLRGVERERVWSAAANLLVAAGAVGKGALEQPLWTDHPKQPGEVGTFGALAALAYAAGDLEAMGAAIAGGLKLLEPPPPEPGGDAGGAAPAGIGEKAEEEHPLAVGEPRFANLTFVWRLLDGLRRTPLRASTKREGLASLLGELEALRGEARAALESGALDERSQALPGVIFLAWGRVQAHLVARLRATVKQRDTSGSERGALSKRIQELSAQLEAFLSEELIPLRRLAREGSLRSPQAYRVLVWILVAGGDVQAAALEIERALKIAPTDPYLRYLRGTLALRAGDEEGARAVWTDLVRAQPEMLDALYLDGFRAWKAGEYDLAAPLLARVTERDERFQDAVFLAGLVAWRRGRIDESEALLKRSVQLDPQDMRARTALELIAYERRKQGRDLQPVLDRLEKMRARLEEIDRRHPLLAYVRALQMKIDRARDAREFLDRLDRSDKLALFDWHEPAEARGVHALLGPCAVQLAEANEFGAQPSGGCLHFAGAFEEKGRTSFWTKELVKVPANFLSLEADVIVGAGDQALVGVAVGRMQMSAEGRGPELDNASFVVGIASGVDQATGERTTYYRHDSGSHEGWKFDSESFDSPVRWPAGTPVHLRIETNHFRGVSGPVAEVRMSVGDQVVHPSSEWLETRHFKEKSGGQGLTLLFFAEGAEGQKVDYQVDNIRIRYRSR